MAHCIICGVEDGPGYIIPVAHFDNEISLEFEDEHTKRYYINPKTHFNIYSADAGNAFVHSVEGFNVLEGSGIDIFDRIDINEPFVEIKLLEDKCQYCRAKEQQLKLF